MTSRRRKKSPKLSAGSSGSGQESAETPVTDSERRGGNLARRRRKLLRRVSSHLVIRVIAVALCVVAPVSVLILLRPGRPPASPPILNVYQVCGRPTPLEVHVDSKFRVRVELDLSMCQGANWEAITVQLPISATNVQLSQADYTPPVITTRPDVELDSMAAAELRLHGSESLSVLYIRRGPYEAAFRTRQSTRLQDVPAVEVMEGARVLFDLPSAMIRRSFAERTLILFYLPDAGNTQQSESFSVKLFTPVTIFLDASVPEVQRVLVFGDQIVYDVDAISSDSGLLFKFADTSRAAFQEVTLFLLSAIFGFASALLLEDVIKYATNASKRRRRAA